MNRSVSCLLLVGFLPVVSTVGQDLVGGELKKERGTAPHISGAAQTAPATPAGSHTLSGGVDVGWVRHYVSGLLPGVDEATAVAVDASGNTYVTGSSYGLTGFTDYVTIKYNAAGVEQWVARYNGPGSGDDRPSALVLDDSGNIYVTGKSLGSGTSYDFATVKYSGAGEELWVVRYNGPAAGDDRANALAVDNLGDVIVTGGSKDSSTDLDYATVKYTASGVEWWVSRYDGPGNGIDEPSALVVDDSGSIYVTGRSDSSIAHTDYATVKYHPSGAEQWVARYNGPGNGADRPQAMAVDDSGNVYVTGESRSSSSSRSADYATIKYNPAGAEQWVATYNAPWNMGDHAYAIGVDASGNVYVTGRSKGTGTSYDYATVKYNAAGIEQWVARYNGPGDDDDRASSLAVDDSGNVYVTGESIASGTGYDYATVKYNPSGIQQWVARFDWVSDQAVALAVDGSGNVYVTGSSSSGDASVYATIMYVQQPVTTIEALQISPSGYSFSQNYPNPFNPSTTIEFGLPHAGYVTLTVHNVLGQEVATLIAGDHAAGTFKATWDASGMPSGVYFYRLTAGDYVQSKKAVLMK